MEVHPSKHLVLINGNTYQNSWYEGDTHISYKYPKALAERWRNYFNNQMVDVSHELRKDYHFIGSIFSQISSLSSKGFHSRNTSEVAKF